MKSRLLLPAFGAEGNPLNDLSALQKVTFVMKAGQPVDLTTL